jgi:hypothetical protein
LQVGSHFNGKVQMEKQSALKIAPELESVDDSNADAHNMPA